MRTDRLEREFGITSRWTVFPLHPEIPEQGMELAELFQGRGIDVGTMQRKVKSVAEELALPMERGTLLAATRRAQELGKWAEDLGRGDQFRRGVFHAYFAEDRNIALLPELELIAERAGLPGDEVFHVLGQGLFAEAVDADWARSRELAVTAVPFHLYRGAALVGFHPYEDYVRLVSGG